MALCPTRSPSSLQLNICNPPCNPKPKTTLSFLHTRPRGLVLGAKQSCSARKFSSEAESKDKASFYELLGIPIDGSSEAIKQAYRHLALKYHPDVCPDPFRTEEYTRQFVKVQEAYEVLSDPTKRRVYDQFLNSASNSMPFSVYLQKRGNHSEMEIPREEWRSRWQDQLAELKRRSAKKKEGSPLSWAAKIRQQNAKKSSSTS
eukprot:TRINITY_DN10040_c0_g1_i1.p1 TRINITY_DN10040_c0_g1~~TRINITY_DN10040_c0_g1_i1.p1  ORF type:complete len:203 (+),score=38.34 TRINITY_DN10040_c0_g1_i1:155-763(+)